MATANDVPEARLYRSLEAAFAGNAVEGAQLIPAAGEAALSGDTLGEVARQFLLARAAIDRESRVVDPLVLHAFLKVGRITLDSEAAANAAVAALAAVLPPELIRLNVLRDDKNDAWMLKITRQLHGNVLVTALDQDFLATADYDILCQTRDMLHGLLRDGAAPVVFDIRAPGFRDVDPYVIPGAVFADERQLDGILATYPRDGKVVIYCACPDEVSAAWMAARLREAGFRDVLPLRGGIDAWRDAGYAVERIGG
mgnify:CR=1 FL=1